MAHLGGKMGTRGPRTSLGYLTARARAAAGQQGTVGASKLILRPSSAILRRSW